MDIKSLRKDDPLQRQAVKDSPKEELSPMSPPDAYAPPRMEELDYDDLNPFLQGLVDDHKSITESLDSFEKALISIRQNGLTKEIDNAFREFFHLFDHTFIPHDQKEEKELFPLLGRRLIEAGEHGQGEKPVTAVDMMEDDHLKAVQLAAVVFNLLGLSVRLPDARSRVLVLDAALEQGKNLVELLRLHIFREDHIVFPMAHKYIKGEEFDRMNCGGEKRA